MKLFGRNGKAREKWRAAARMIDMHKTRVTIIQATQVSQRVQHAPQWFNQTMLDAAPDDSCTRHPVMPDPEMPQRYFSQDMQTTLRQYFG